MRQEINKPTYVPNSGAFKIHNVHILDCSGSMVGKKHENAVLGINEEINKLKGSEESKNMTLSIVEFDSRYNLAHQSEARITKPYWLTPIRSISSFGGRRADGGTPLYQTIGETIEGLLMHVFPEDKVIITVFTDGEENDSKGQYANPGVLKALMDRVQENNNFTITFMGTKRDVDTMIRRMGISEGNTLVHENTAESILHSYGTRGASVMSYSKSVNSGEFATTKTFFKEVETEK